MLKVTPEQATTALNEFINLGEELKPMVTETDLVERFLLTLHQYHRWILHFKKFKPQFMTSILT